MKTLKIGIGSDDGTIYKCDAIERVGRISLTESEGRSCYGWESNY